jgi:hypothetical protein
LGIDSEIRLSALAEGRAAADVRVRRGEARFPAVAGERRSWFTKSETLLRYEGVGVLRITAGREIMADPAEGADDATLELFILGPGLAVLLHQRGLQVLHASAVTVEDGKAVAFLGMSGWGKSTMAGALAKRKHKLLADDMVAVLLESGRPMALPGFSRLKLGLEAATALGYPGRELPPLLPDDARRDIRVEADPSAAARPLKRIYVLAVAETPSIELLKPQDAMVELIRHSFLARCLKATEGSAAHLQVCAALVSHVPICRLKRPRRLGQIGEVAQMVEADLQERLVAV